MYYVVNGVEAASKQGLANSIKRAFERIGRQNPGGFGEWLEIRPFTEKGVPSVRYKKFKIHVNNYSGNKTIFIYGGDSVSYKVYEYVCLYATYINARVHYID